MLKFGTLLDGMNTWGYIFHFLKISLFWALGTCFSFVYILNLFQPSEITNGLIMLNTEPDAVSTLLY